MPRPRSSRRRTPRSRWATSRWTTPCGPARRWSGSSRPACATPTRWPGTATSRSPRPGWSGTRDPGSLRRWARASRRSHPGRRWSSGGRFAARAATAWTASRGTASSLGPLVAGGARGDGSTTLRRVSGEPLHSHFFGQSSFASYSVCAASALVPVPSDAAVELLGPLSCGIATGAGAILNVLRPPVGSSVVILRGGRGRAGGRHGGPADRRDDDNRGGPGFVAAEAGARARGDRDDQRGRARHGPGGRGRRDLRRRRPTSRWTARASSRCCGRPPTRWACAARSP